MDTQGLLGSVIRLERAVWSDLSHREPVLLREAHGNNPRCLERQGIWQVSG